VFRLADLRTLLPERRTIFGVTPNNRSKENSMLKTNSSYREALAAPRQAWLAGLGAAVVTREWVQNEASLAFKSLVRQGTTVESRAIRLIGDQIELSMTRANSLWRKTRSTVEGAVKVYADQAVAIAQQALPKSLPKVELPFVKAAPAKPAKKTRAKKATAARKTRRIAKTASKR
jgi:hypothetical protein